MKTFILFLSLAAATAWAKPPAATAHCPKSGLGFSVHFCEHPTVSTHSGTTAYGWASKSSPRQSERVYITSTHNLKQLKDFAVKNMPKGCNVGEEKLFHLGAYEGVQLEGLSESGVPFTYRVLPTASHSYIYGSTNYDMAHNREFVNSFAITAK